MTAIIKSDEQALSKSREMFHEFICHNAQDQKIFFISGKNKVNVNTRYGRD